MCDYILQYSKRNYNNVDISLRVDIIYKLNTNNFNAIK